MPACEPDCLQVVRFVIRRLVGTLEDGDLRRLVVTAISYQLQLRLAKIGGKTREIPSLQRVRAETQQVMFQERVVYRFFIIRKQRFCEK